MNFPHVRARMLQRLEDMQETAQSERRSQYRAESMREAELLPDTRARIEARWKAREEELSQVRKPHPVEPKVLKPIPIRKAAGA